MKKLIMVILISFILGCGTSTQITSNTVEEVRGFCDKNGGLKNFTHFGNPIHDSIDFVQCQDNAKFNLEMKSFYHYTSNGHSFSVDKKKHYNTVYRYVIED